MDIEEYYDDFVVSFICDIYCKCCGKSHKGDLEDCYECLAVIHRFILEDRVENIH